MQTHIGKCDSIAGVSNTSSTCLYGYIKTAPGTAFNSSHSTHLTPRVHVVMRLRRIHFGQEETGLEGKMWEYK